MSNESSPSPPTAGLSPPPGGESSKSFPPPPPNEGDDSPPSSSPPPPQPSPGSPPPAPLQSPPPPSSKSSPPPRTPPPSKSPPPHSEPPTTSPPKPSTAPPNSSSPPPPPSSSSVSPSPSAFLPPPISPPPETPFTTPPPAGVSLSPPPPPGPAILSPPPPGAAFILPPPPPSAIPLTPSRSASSPVPSPPARHSTTTSSDVNSSNISSTSPGGGNDAGETTSTKVVVGGIVAAAVLLGVIALFFVFEMRRKKQKAYASHNMPPTSFAVNTANHSYGSQTRHSGVVGDSFGSQRGNMCVGGEPESGVMGGSKSSFAYDEVMEMTNGFARQNIIGEGGFGCVYKGWTSDGREVAVKQLKAGSGQGDREFKAEVEIISRVHHRHLVSLVGYSMSDHQRMLIYEFVPNKTLEHHLHAKGLQVLDWPKRLKIAIGSAKGLAYLHEDCHPKIIHRDIKSANILLDDDFEAQVADFGLARLYDTTQTHVSTRVMGTFGYLAPEYASSGKLTDRSDVFSFGVVLLELITGRKPVDPTQPLGDESLVEWARPHLVRAVETGDLSELVDPQLKKHHVESEMFRMVEAAAACIRHSAPKRPRMVQVVRALDCECEMSDLSNGMKYGQSTAYDSGQYNQEIMNFRRMALGSKEDSEFNTYSGEYTSRDVPRGPLSSSGYTSSDSETQAMNKAAVGHR